ncbi:hypothetical protein [Pseudomonas luteola]|uniref:Uncharacterized protein n=1 Tax=Pseudomonas luteola TaxID=47886 RepID=A0ABS0FS21_PSELU|nr:hypothetical protein [Pseudomonas zeshuii]MBF8643079.1 hypothetical protein [Pseudomonas zeshuii]
MEIWSFVWNAVTTAIGAGVGTYILSIVGKSWFEARIKASIDHEYALKLESFKAELLRQNAERADEMKRDLQIRDRAAKVAELMAEWYSWPDNYKQLNALTFEAFLWLPDDVLKDLSAVLSHDRDAPDVREVISKVRVHLLGRTSLKTDDIIVFPQDAIKNSHKHNSQMVAYPRGYPAGPPADKS